MKQSKTTTALPPIPVKDEGLGITKGVWKSVGLGKNDMGMWKASIKSYKQNNIINIISNVSGRSQTECEANAKAICTAVNNTYGKGFDPSKIEELYEALERARDWFYAHAKGKKIYANGVTPSCIPYIETALTNSKL